MIPLEILLSYSIASCILDVLFFHMKLSVVLSRSATNWVGILRVLHWICRLLWWNGHYCEVNPPNTWECNFWYLFKLSFFKDLEFFSHSSFTCLVKVTQTYFILFNAFVKGYWFYDFIHSPFIIYLLEDYWFFFLIDLASSLLTKGVYQL